MLARIGAPEIPVACGLTAPLEGDNAAPPMWRDSADALGNVSLPETPPLAEKGAAELLIETIERSPRNITLVALGPLTNVAEALAEKPDLLDKVDMIYLMGGAVDVSGNVFMIDELNQVAEFNIWADPTAAAIVFDTEVPITLIPLDATNDVPVTPYLYEAVAAHRNASPTATFTADYLAGNPLLGGLYHWDELAAVTFMDESVVTIENRTISITTGPDGQEGATVDDPNGRPVRVAIAADQAAFEGHFYEAIIGTADPGIPPWEPDAVLTWDGSTCTYEGPDPLPDELWVRLDNNSSADFLAMVTGTFNAGTTRADFEAAKAAAEPGEPDWWLSSGVVAAPAGAHEVWPARGGDAMSALCYIDPSRVWEVAGPRLPEE